MKDVRSVVTNQVPPSLSGLDARLLRKAWGRNTPKSRAKRFRRARWVPPPPNPLGWAGVGHFFDTAEKPFSPDYAELYHSSIASLPNGSVVAAIEPHGLLKRSPSGKVQALDHRRVHTLVASPDGRYLAYGVRRAVRGGGIGPSERIRLVLRDLTTGESREFPEQDDNQIGAAFSPDGRYVAYTGWPGLLRVMELSSGAPVPIPPSLEGIKVMKPVWSSDGRLAVIQTEDYTTGSLRIVSIGRRGEDLVIQPQGSDRCVIPYAFSPGNSRFLLVSQVNVRGLRTLHRLDLDSGRMQAIGPQDSEVEGVVWGPHGISFTQNIHGQVRLFHLRRSQGKAIELLRPSGCARHLALGRSGELLFLWGRSDRPHELMSLDPLSGRRKQLTHLRPSTLSGNNLARAQPFDFKSDDGLLVRGFYSLPTGLPLSNPPPAIALVHGGPFYQDSDEFNPMVQALCSAGFAVVQVNFRGSSGEGIEFAERLRGELGRADAMDVRAGMASLRANGIIGSRWGIMGHSHGGYVSLMPLVDGSDPYAARLAISAVTDLFLQYRRAPRLRKWLEHYMGAPTTIEGRVHFARRSPFGRADVLAARPLMLVHGSNDENVPVEHMRHLSRELADWTPSGSPCARAWELAGEGHILSSTAWKNLAVRAIEFFRDALAPETLSSDELDADLTLYRHRASMDLFEDRVPSERSTKGPQAASTGRGSW